MEKFDLIVIGSGPGGYVAAIRAAQRGMKVACVEKENSLGGTCLNVGCIPSKALLHSTEYYHKVAEEGKEHGIEAKELKVNLTQMMARKEKVVLGLTDGVAFLFKKNKVTRIAGEAQFTSSTTLQVGKETYSARHFILATGSEPIGLPFLPFDEKRVLSSTGALSLPEIPKKLLMVGAGVIGLELGSVYRRMGAEVEVVELLDRATPTLDREVSKTVLQILKKQGMTFHLSSKVVSGKVGKTGVTLEVEEKNGSKISLEGDHVLVAIGRRPYAKGLNLDKIGVAQDKIGRVVINGNFQTSIPHIYAIGDLVDGPMLAHKASEEGVAVVDLLAGDTVRVNYLAIPNVMYTWPEVAAVGMSEEEAKEAGLVYAVGKFPFKAVARARCSGDVDGFVKVLAEKKSDRIIGMHIIGPGASEMIHEGVLAIERGLTAKQIAHASHAHPTCSEGIKEACLAVHNSALHI